MVLPKTTLSMMATNALLLEAFALCCEATRPRCFAFLAIGMFLAINGFLLKVEPTEAVNTMLALAAGNLTELELASWIEKFILKDTLRYR